MAHANGIKICYFSKKPMQTETTNFPQEISRCKRKQQISRRKSSDANGNSKFPAGNRPMQMETTNFPQEIG